MNPSGCRSDRADPGRCRGEQNCGADENQQPRRRLLRGERGAAGERKARPTKIAQREAAPRVGRSKPLSGLDYWPSRSPSWALRDMCLRPGKQNGFVYRPAERVTGERSDDHPLVSGDRNVNKKGGAEAPPESVEGLATHSAANPAGDYLSSTEPPASSSSPLSLSASSRSMPSLIGFGASSTSAFASFRPRPVAARTTLMTWIFLSPAAVRTTSTVVDSSSAGPPSAPPPAAGAAAATAVADTPNSSSSALMRSASSATEMPLSSSIQSWVLVAISCLLLRSKSRFPVHPPQAPRPRQQVLQQALPQQALPRQALP